jgi:hypothetical protein
MHTAYFGDTYVLETEAVRYSLPTGQRLSFSSMLGLHEVVCAFTRWHQWEGSGQVTTGKSVNMCVGEDIGIIFTTVTTWRGGVSFGLIYVSFCIGYKNKILFP